jgi:hypothetical protein
VEIHKPRLPVLNGVMQFFKLASTGATLLSRRSQMQPLFQFGRTDRTLDTSFLAQCLGNGIQLLVGVLGDIEQQPLAAADEAMPAAIAAEPILPNFIAQSACGIERFLQHGNRMH